MKLQRQDSLTDQMETVLKLATEAGCYDAADWLKRIFFKIDNYPKETR
jgi:hypothetical protein